MSTTSLKIPDDVKKMATAAAQQQGVTPHAFMVDAIRVIAAAAEKRAQFVSDAAAARAESLKSGLGYDLAEVSSYLLERVNGEMPTRPSPKLLMT